MDNLSKDPNQISENHDQNPIPIRSPKSKKSLLISAGITVAVLIAITLFGLAYLSFKTGTSTKTSGPIAEINDTLLPGSFLDKEIEFFPGEVTMEIKTMLQQKVIDDEVTLIAAKNEGLISSYVQNAKPSKEDYLARTNQVNEIKQKINDSANSIEITVVSIWFYNNDYIGPKGLAEGKRIVYSKIKPLYDQVKSGKISIQRAGEIIRNDTTLKEIDPVWEVNALDTLKFQKNDGKKGYTFWADFDKMIWQTNVGEITPLYLGSGRHKNGKLDDELYIFAKVEKKINDKGFSSYEEWLKDQKTKVTIVKKELSFNNPLKKIIAGVQAQEDSSVSSSDNSQGSIDSNSQNDSGGGDNCNSADPWGCGDGHGYAGWSLNVISETGAPVPNAKIRYTNGCSKMTKFEDQIADKNGLGSLGPGFGYGCGCNGHEFSVYYQPPARRLNSEKNWFSQVFAADLIPSPPDKLCGEASKSIGNGAGQVGQTLTCTPNYVPKATPGPGLNPAGKNPLPTPNPNLSCGKSCSQTADCGNYPEDGCTVCAPNAQGRKVCSPAACGVSCSRDDECAGAEKDSCQACEGGKCSYFDQSACACDGFDAEALDYPGNFIFNAFSKVEGAKIANSMVKGVQFKMSESDKLHPNDGTIIAQSDVVEPTIVSNSGEKVRYQANWHITPPEIKAGKIYRVYQEIKCAPKRNPVADAANPYQYKSVAGIQTANAQELEVARNDMQLKNLNLIKRGDTDKCKFLIFEYDNSKL